jgi:hypothetical protein
VGPEWMMALAEDLKAVTGIITAVGIIILGWLQYRAKQAAEKVAATVAKDSKIASVERKEVATKVEEARVTLVEHNANVDSQLQKIDETTQSASVVADATHTLVNNKMAVELLAVKELSQWKADREPTQANIDAARAAAKMYDDHMTKQGRVDRGEKT